jgi:copper chaperone CopZ
MTCGSCATAVKIVLDDTPGVTGAAVSYADKRADVTFDTQKTTPQKIAAAITAKLPYTVTVIGGKKAVASANVSPSISLAAYRAEELRDEFNRASDRVRVVALLSPTCSYCQHGQRVVQSVFSKFSADQRLRGFVVWLPMLPTDDERAAMAQAGAFTDARLRQEWDGSRASGVLLSKTLNLKRAAWDVYLLYAPGVKWTGDVPPQPTFWMHQLRADSGADQKACLNPAVFLSKVAELLRRG